MDDLISRQAAIDALAEYIHNVDKVIGTGHLTADDCKDAAASVFEELPSAQPGITLESAIDYLHSIGWMQEHDRTLTESAQPERKKGKWIPVTNGRGGFECDECHNYAPSFQDGVEWLSDYCPNCGTRMEELDE